ncbi:hypothetical protein [Neptuniibacter sp. QD37_11]|uniref:hypothetical protein n=1 Tax=Neptuniibacter sp. QD37_11 TaxID=3398209 RepID=UPI0039F4B307
MSGKTVVVIGGVSTHHGTAVASLLEDQDIKVVTVDQAMQEQQSEFGVSTYGRDFEWPTEAKAALARRTEEWQGGGSKRRKPLQK